MGSSVFEAASSASPSSLSEILLSGGDVNSCDRDGNTPLHLAAYAKRPRNVEILISFGADLDARNSMGWTPLHMAAVAGDIDSLSVLARAGADLSATTAENETPFDFINLDREQIAGLFASSPLKTPAGGVPFLSNVFPDVIPAPSQPSAQPSPQPSAQPPTTTTTTSSSSSSSQQQPPSQQHPPSSQQSMDGMAEKWEEEADEMLAKVQRQGEEYARIIARARQPVVVTIPSPPPPSSSSSTTTTINTTTTTTANNTDNVTDDATTTATTINYAPPSSSSFFEEEEEDDDDNHGHGGFLRHLANSPTPTHIIPMKARAVPTLSLPHSQSPARRVEVTTEEDDEAAVVALAGLEADEAAVGAVFDAWVSDVRASFLAKFASTRQTLEERYNALLSETEAAHAEENEANSRVREDLEAHVSGLETALSESEANVRVLDAHIRKLEGERDKAEAETKTKVAEAQQVGIARASHIVRSIRSQRLLRSALSAWSKMVQRRRIRALERACEARVEEAAQIVTEEYSAQLDQAYARIAQLEADLEAAKFNKKHYQDGIKAAFMRGVSALNIEAIEMFGGDPEEFPSFLEASDHPRDHSHHHHPSTSSFTTVFPDQGHHHQGQHHQGQHHHQEQHNIPLALSPPRSSVKVSTSGPQPRVVRVRPSPHPRNSSMQRPGNPNHNPNHNRNPNHNTSSVRPKSAHPQSRRRSRASSSSARKPRVIIERFPAHP